MIPAGDGSSSPAGPTSRSSPGPLTAGVATPARNRHNQPVLAPLLIIIAALSRRSSRPAARRRRHLAGPRGDRLPPQARPWSPRDGAVRSVQSAELTARRARTWSASGTPANLENLARTYWRFLSRVTLGLIRVVYGDDSRSVVLIARPLTLLRFDKPRVHDRARSRQRPLADPGRPARRPPRPRLGFPVARRQPSAARDRPDAASCMIEVEVANFYPSIAAGFSMPVYEIDPVRHPRAGHPRLPALAGQARPGRVQGRRLPSWPTPDGARPDRRSAVSRS